MKPYLFAFWIVMLIVFIRVHDTTFWICYAAAFAALYLGLLIRGRQ